MPDRELPVTIPLGPRRLSREFLAVGVPLTPERARLHALDTLPCDYFPAGPDVMRTGRIEDKLARKIRSQHLRSDDMGVALVLLATALGLGVGYLLMAMVTR